MGYPCIVGEGPYERGSDVVVTLNDPVLPDSVEITIGVQVFASEGTVEEGYFLGKLNQLLEGWDYNGLDHGALLSTGEFSKESEEALRRHNEDYPDRLVRLIDGNELADLFLEFFPPGVVEEIRQHSKAHATEHGNDLERIVQAVRKRERDSDGRC